MSAPAILIRIELESSPTVHVDAPKPGDRERLYDWINSQYELVHLLKDAEGLRQSVIVECPDPDDDHSMTILGGAYRGMTLAEVVMLGKEGEHWFVGMLARLSADDWMRPAIEAYVRKHLPEIWSRYCAWSQRVCDHESRPERLRQP